MEVIAEVLNNFGSNTSLHGISYTINPCRHKIERVFWVLAVFISFILTGLLIYKLIIESEKNPTVIYTDQNVIKIQEIAFPAVTFCIGLSYRTECESLIEYPKVISKLNENKHNINNLTENQLKLLQVISLVTDDPFMHENFPNLNIPTDDFMETLEIFHKLLPLKIVDDSSIITNKWLDQFVMSGVQILTNTANCFTFNLPPLDKIYNPESILYEFSQNRTYNFKTMDLFSMHWKTRVTEHPQKARGINEGLTLEYDFNHYCLHQNGTKGFTNYSNGTILSRLIFGVVVNVHSPYEVISRTTHKFNLKYTELFTLAITPKISKIDESLIDSSIDDRQCYMPKERKLRFFKVYNKVNCDHECLAQMTLKSCGCVQFFMARNNLTKICGIQDWRCFHKIEESFDEHKGVCKCYDSCENIKYEVALKAVEKPYDGERLTYNTVLMVNVQFAVDTVFAICKKKSQNAVEFLSFVGGILGLFAGFSALTSFEILYYFLPIPIMLIRRRKNRSKVQPFIESENIAKNMKTSKLIKSFKYTRNLFKDSTVHSFSQIGGDDKSFFERLAWLVLFTTSMILTVIMVRDVHTIYKNSVIVMNYEGNPTKVDEVSFPAMTIVRDLEFIPKSFTDNITKINQKDGYYYEMVNRQFKFLMCAVGAHYLMVYPFRFKTNHDLVGMLNYYTFNQYPWFATRNVTWNSQVDPPFAQIITSTLKGYAFNLMEHSKLLTASVSEDFNYTYGAKTNPNYPWRTSSSDNSGLKIEIDTDQFHSKENDICLLRDSIVLHPPNELPLYMPQTTIELYSTYKILITPEIIKSEDSLKLLDLNVRKCYFDGERKLKFFKIYTQKNCELECLSHAANRKCGCIPHNQIRNNSARVCDQFSTRACIIPHFKFFNISQYEDLYVEYGVCNCLPPCNYVKYNYEMHLLSDHLRLKRNSWEFCNVVFDLKWKDNEYFALVRHQQLGLVDFLAYVGGILGLFAGISVLSLFELTYFLTLRLFFDLLRYFKQK